MRIERVEVSLLEAGFLSSSLFQRRMATPMSPFPEFAERRSLWMWPPEKVVTTVRAEGGLEGVSITNGGAVVATIVRDQLRRLIEGRDGSDLQTLWEIMFRSLLPFDRSGFAMMAVAGVDVALWDLKAKTEGRPLVDLLGGEKPGAVTAYVTTVRPEAFAGGGFTGIKIPMAFGPADGPDGVAGNVAAIARAREAAGPERDVMLDAFMGWDVDYTLRMAEALRPFRVRWFEDPLPPTDIDGYVRLHERAADEIALALGNFCFHRWDCAQLLEAGLASILQPDVAWAGGVTECLRIADLARRHGVPMILHNTSEQPWALALSAALPGVSEVEYVDRDGGSMLHELFEGGPTVGDGRLDLDRAHVGQTLSPRVRDALATF